MLTGDGAAQALYRRAAGTAEVRAARGSQEQSEASAERQCHLVAGGAHTRFSGTALPTTPNAPRPFWTFHAGVLSNGSNDLGLLPPAAL